MSDSTPKKITTFRNIDNPGKKFTIPQFEGLDEGTTVRKWFENHPGQKPTVSVYKLTELEAITVAKVIMRCLEESTPLSVKHVNSFIHYVEGKWKIEIADDWASYNTKICEKGLQTPWIPLKVEEVPYGAHGQEREKTYNEQVRDGLMLYLLGLVRVIRSDVNSNHQSTLYSKLVRSAAATAYSCSAPLTTALMVAEGLSMNDDHLKLLASLDMSLEKSRAIEYQKYRQGTIITRYKDMASYSVLAFFVDSLGIDFSLLLTWIWNSKMIKELERLSEPTDEIDKKDSYFPYQCDLRLVLKCRYSTIANPLSHFFFDSVLALMKHERSINSRKLDTAPHNLVIHEVAIMSDAFRHIVENTAG